MALLSSSTLVLSQWVGVRTYASKTPEQASGGASCQAIVQLILRRSAHVFVGYRSPSLLIPSLSVRDRGFNVAVT
jgi:hypothetical protein